MCNTDIIELNKNRLNIHAMFCCIVVASAGSIRLPFQTLHGSLFRYLKDVVHLRKSESVRHLLCIMVNYVIKYREEA